jgi:tryptophan synthase alpha chain
MNAIRTAFERAKQEKRAALVTYVMSGDPSLEATLALVPRLVEAGADVVELGVPFSDPIADGPVLQAAATRALAAGTTVAKVLAMAAQLRVPAPLVAMGYLNPIASYGEARFAADAAKAGLAGVIIPDLPSDEAVSFTGTLRESRLSYVPLVTPTTAPERARRIASLGDGFVYYVSVTGVTGARAALPDDLGARVAEARAASNGVPVAIGFGISTPEQARAAAAHADGVVVGSALVKTLHERGPDAAVALVAALRKALDGTR